MMAIRTTTTRTTRAEFAPSADPPAPFPFHSLLQAYYDCRKTKRNSVSALAFEARLERNLVQLYDELITGEYSPGKSICFVITRPKPREVWAADFRDRIVHHLMYNHVAQRFIDSFIADSCACIPGRGTLYAVNRLERKIRSQTQNWKRPGFYLKADLANFFVAINKQVLLGLLRKRIHEPFWMRLTEQILMHDPRLDAEYRGPVHLLGAVPKHKRLGAQPDHLGLPIGNLSSQFFANVYLNELDQFVKHELRAKHYIRYVDDFVILHESAQQLNAWLAEIEQFLPTLGARINPTKTILQPIERGIDFVGQVIKPWRRTTRKRVVKEAVKRVSAASDNDLVSVANSYFGLMRQATHSHKDRAALARALLRRGRAVNGKLTKVIK